MPDTQAIIAHQVDMYGEPLSVRFGRLLHAYRLSQAKLAGVIGLSPPMLSQLMSGQREKISNPAVLGRVVRLEEMLGSPAVRGGDPGAIADVVEEVSASRPTLSTRLVVSEQTGDELVDAAARALAMTVSREALVQGARQVTDGRLRTVLSAAAGLSGVEGLWTL